MIRRVASKIHGIAGEVPFGTIDNGCSTGVVSFSFDDFPASAGVAGAHVLEDHGYRGTYYVSGCYMGKKLWGVDYYSDQDLVRLVEAGHEIGCHTFSHLRLTHASPMQIFEDFERNREYVSSVLPRYKMRSFAYPNGDLSYAWKRRVAKLFDTGRGIKPGANGRRIDPWNLRAWPYYRGFGPDKVRELLEGIEAGGWLNFFTHDVSETPTEYGCTPGELSFLLSEVQKRGLRCATVGEAFGLVRSGTEAGSG